MKNQSNRHLNLLHDDYGRITLNQSDIILVLEITWIRSRHSI